MLLPAATVSRSAVVTDAKALKGPGVPVAVNDSGLPASPVDVAASVFVPAVVPSAHLPTVAMPLALVVADPPVTEPPPEPMAKVTATPATGLFCASRTSAEGATATEVLTVADWPFPLEIVICVGPPGTTVIVGCGVVTSDPSIVAPILRAVPAASPVKIAVYVPSP